MGGMDRRLLHIADLIEPDCGTILAGTVREAADVIEGLVNALEGVREAIRDQDECEAEAIIRTAIAKVKGEV